MAAASRRLNAAVAPSAGCRHTAAMRALLALVLLPAIVAGCTPYIPVKDDFGTSALAPAGDLPPEFVEFNAYNPAVNTLLADQLCPTPYQPLEEKKWSGLGMNPLPEVQNTRVSAMGRAIRRRQRLHQCLALYNCARSSMHHLPPQDYWQA